MTLYCPHCETIRDFVLEVRGGDEGIEQETVYVCIECEYEIPENEIEEP